MVGLSAYTDWVGGSKLALTGLLFGIDAISVLDDARGDKTNLFVEIIDPPADEDLDTEDEKLHMEEEAKNV